MSVVRRDEGRDKERGKRAGTGANRSAPRAGDENCGLSSGGPLGEPEAGQESPASMGWSVVFSLIRESCKHYGRRLGLPPQEIEEAEADARLGLWQLIGEGLDPQRASLRTLARLSAWWATHDRAKRASRSREIPTDPFDLDHLFSRFRHLLSPNVRERLLAALIEEVEKLPPRQRECFKAKYLSSCPPPTTKELAHRPATSEDAVEKSLWRARARVRWHLQKEGFEDPGIRDFFNS